MTVIVAGDPDPEELRNFLDRLGQSGGRGGARPPVRVVVGSDAAGGDKATRLHLVVSGHGRAGIVVAPGGGASFASQVNAALAGVHTPNVVLATPEQIGGVADVQAALTALRAAPRAHVAMVRPARVDEPAASVATSRPLAPADWSPAPVPADISPGLMVGRSAVLGELRGLDESYETEIAVLDLALRCRAAGGDVLVAEVARPLRQRPPGPAHERDLVRLRRVWSLPGPMVRSVLQSVHADALPEPTWRQGRMRRARSAVRNVRRGHAQSPTYLDRSEDDWRSLAEQVPVHEPAGNGPDVLYLLPAIAPYGGVISVLQLVNRLCMRGVRAAVATFGGIDLPGSDEVLVHRPVGVSHRRELQELMDAPRLVVSTSWDTVYDALLLRRQWGSRLVSYIQDFEPDFYPASPGTRAAARLSLELVGERIVKTAWLADKLAALPGTTHRVPPGLNLDVFYPAGPGSPRHGVVCAARPGVAVRNLMVSVEMLRRASQQIDELEVTFFGRPFRHRSLRAVHAGMLSQRGVATLLRRSAALLDASLFQAFGRPGLEAMACGTPAVLTSRGGINEYAQHERNCLQVDPASVVDGAEALVRILREGDLSGHLRTVGLATAERYDVEREVDRTTVLLASL